MTDVPYKDINRHQRC